MTLFNYLLHQVAPFGVSLIIVIVLTPVWISICKKWNLFDEPDSRKHHRHMIPSMGGIAIFAGLFISFLSFAEIHDLEKLRFLFGAALILFFTGFFDDLMDVPAKNKLMLQIGSGLVAFAGGYRIETFNGFLGIHEIPLLVQLPATVLLIVGFTNAFNFIDGIDGLAATLGLVFSFTMGILFLEYAKTDYAMLCFCMCGALAGFLVYNISPARIFMGDTGSLIVGFVVVILAVELCNAVAADPNPAYSNPSRVLAILFVPLFDISRVLVIRFLNGNSPFAPDRNHLHHLILKFGFGHTAAMAIIVSISIGIILLQHFMQSADMHIFLLAACACSLLAINSRTLLMLVRMRSFLKPGWNNNQNKLQR
jgi:UDP-GlcNAc:undecaprenyl-phosphate GlcNAc-1-phosphate transferase